MNSNWMAKASWYELLASCFGDARLETAEALASGEFADAFVEIAEALELNRAECEAIVDNFATYRGQDAEAIFHEQRKEATRLYIGVKADPLVVPYEGVWDAQRQGKKALLIVGKKSLAIENFMKSCRVARPEGYGGPVDHMGTILEFLSYLCLSCADALANGDTSAAEERIAKYETFYCEHFIEYARYFGSETKSLTSSKLFEGAAHALLLLPESAL